MIVFIGPNRQRSNAKHLSDFANAPKIKHKTYNWLFRTFRIPAATYIFAAVDRLDFNERRLAGKVYRHINAAGKGYKALNDPAHAKGRFALLRGLYEAGMNDFNAYEGSSNPHPARFPVFIRRGHNSGAPLGGLINSQAELDAAIKRLSRQAEPLGDLVVIEYCAEQLAPGVFQKVSLHYINGCKFQSYTYYDDQWIVKYGLRNFMSDKEHLADRERMHANVYADHFERVFQLAKIEYGRADFGFYCGRPQTYEINFHPICGFSKSLAPNTIRQENEEFIVRQRVAALIELDEDATGSIDNISDPEIAAFRMRPWRNYAPQRY